MRKNPKILVLALIVCGMFVGSALIVGMNTTSGILGKSLSVEERVAMEKITKLPFEQKSGNFWLVEKKDERAWRIVNALGIEVVKDYGYYMLINASIEKTNALAFYGIPFEKPSNEIVFAMLRFNGDLSRIPVQLRTYVGQTEFYLVQLIGTPCEEWTDGITSHGTIYGFYNYNTYLVKANVTEIFALSKYNFVNAIYPYHPYFKIGGNLPEFVVQGKTPEKVKIDIDWQKNITGVANEMRKNGINVIKYFSYPEYKLAYIHAQISGQEQLNWLVKKDYVLSISDDPEKKIMNNVAARIVGASALRDLWRNGLGLPVTGNGQVVAIADTGLDTGNPATVIPDFRGRVKTIYDASGDGAGDPDNANLGGHGTHVAGSVAGSGVMSGADTANHIYDGSFAGMAPEAQIHFESIGTNTGSLDYDSITNMATRSYNDGARIWTNSWGSSGAGYTSDSNEVDNYIWNHKDFLILFAAGNDGPARNSLDNEGDAKNCLSVGATQNARPHVNSQGSFLSPTGSSYAMASNIETLAYFSSRGPTDGGYNKPDVCAPGTGIVSTRASTVSDANAGFTWIVPIDANGDSKYDYGAMQGTSMATPVTAGACVLVRDYYTDVEGLTNVSAALIRATMIGGAKPMPGYKYFGIDQGYGRIDIANALIPEPPLSYKFWDWQAVNNGATWEQSVYVNTSEAPLRVVLAWSDYPSAANSNGNVVNNLNLRVIAPDNTEYHGNQFKTGTWEDTQWSTPNPSAYDTVHANEVVNVKNPVQGVWRIQVIGANIAQNDPDPHAPGALDQSFAVYARGPFGPQNISTLRVDRFNENLPLDAPYKNYTDGFIQRVLVKGQSTNQTFRIVNWGNQSATYNLASEVLPSTTTITVAFSASSVTLVPNATAWLNASIVTTSSTPENIYEVRLKAVDSANSNRLDSVVIKLQVVSEAPLKHTQVTRSTLMETTSAIATDPTDGSLWVAYFRQNQSLTNSVYTSSGNGDNYDLIIAHSTDGGKTWTEYSALPGFDRYWTGYVEQEIDWYYWAPSIDVDAGGKVYVAFSTFESVYIVYGDESGWAYTKQEATSYNTNNGRFTFIAPDLDVVARASGQATVFYTFRSSAGNTNYADLKCAYTTNGGGTWTLQALTTTNNLRQYMPSAIYDGTQHWVFFAYRNTGTDTDYYLSYYTGNPGGTWTLNTLHGTGTDGYYETLPSAFRDSSGNIWVSWYSDDDGQNAHFNVKEHKIYVKRYSGGSWSAALKIDATVPGLDINDGMPPAIGEDGSGNVWVGFLEENSNYTTTLHNERWTHYRYALKAAIISKSSFTVTGYKYIDYAGIPVSHISADSYGGNVYFSYTKAPEEWNNEIFVANSNSTDMLGPAAYNLLTTLIHTENNSKILFLNFTSYQNFTLYAHIDDVETGNSNIAGAEYFIDAVGASGSGTPMYAKDGAFNTPIELVNATINGNFLSAGLHRIYVHGRDAAGNWGAYNFIDIYVPENFTIHLYPGKNFISNPLYNPYLDASDLVPQLFAGEKIERWTGSGYTTYTVGGSNPDFTISAHYAFWINATSAHDIKLYGFRQTTQIAVSLSAGYNQIGWTSLTNLTATAWDLTNSTDTAGQIRIVSRWDAVHQVTNTTDVFYLSMQKYNFIIEPGRGYWVWVSTATTLRYNP